MSWQGFSKFCGRTIGFILLIVLAALLYLSIWGIPRRYLDRLQDELKSAGYVVTVKHIRLNLMKGIVIDHLRVFEEEDQLHPMLEANRITLTIKLFDLLNGTVRIDPLVAILSGDHPQSFLQGHCIYILDSGEYKGHVDASLDPRLMASMLGSNQAAMVNTFDCQSHLPAIEVDFSGQAGRDNAIWAAGRMQISNFTYQTVPIKSFGIRCGYTNEILVFDAIRLVLAEGEVTGNVKVRLDKNIADIDVVSTANPMTIARLAGPEIAAYLKECHFGSMRVAARGCVDYGTNALTDIRAEIDGTHCGYAPLDIDRCSLKVAVNQSRLDLTDIQVELYEGTLAGKASLYPLGGATNSQYDVSVRVDDVNLNTLMQSLGYKGNEEIEGLIYSKCVASGVIDKERGNPVSGGGWVRIQDGQLFQLRMFKDFSRMISNLFPGMGTITLTDFGANFMVKDRKIHARDVVLSGPSLAIHGEGYYAFDESMDFIVWVQPPKGKSLLPELSKVTTPFLAKLLAVRLTGTVADPKWWPLNMTRDQLLAMPKDMLVTMPKDLLIGLPKDLLVNLPQEVLVTLPHRLLVTLPKEILVDLPQELFIKLPKKLWNSLKHLRPKKVKP